MEDIDIVKDNTFEFPDFNCRIEMIGPVWQFWECHYCGNATGSRPVQYKKCNSISFEWIRIRGWARCYIRKDS